MNTHQFIFPPPPPPPPPIQATLNQANQAGTQIGHKYGHNNRGDRGERRPHGSRGWGQPVSKRGSRAGNFGALGVPAHAGYTQQTTSPLSAQDVYRPLTTKPGNNYPLPEYPPVQQPHYPASLSNYVRSAATFPAASIASPSPHPEYYNNAQAQLQFHIGQPQNTAYSYSSHSQNISHYPHAPQQYSSAPSRPEHPNNPPLMGPPLRMGFSNGYPGAIQQPQTAAQTQLQSLPSRVNSLQPGTRPFMRPSLQTNPPNISSSTRQDSPNPFPDHRSRGQRRHHDGSGGQRRFNTKRQVVPIVPSFGNPLPVKPPAPQELARRPKKKKRRHNQLGLTPKTLEHESSEEEENDVDEEANLAITASLPNSARQQLQFTYKGRTSTLQSGSEITAWLEERKKRFPTKARMEEQKESQRQLQEKQRAATQLLIEARAKQRAEAKEKKKINVNGIPSGSCTKEQEVETQDMEKAASMMPIDAASKAKLKVEKLRRRLEKEERRVAKAEARASRLKVGANEDKTEGQAPGTCTMIKKRRRSESVASETRVKGEEAPVFMAEAVPLLESEAATALQQDHQVSVKKEENVTEDGHVDFLSQEHKTNVPSTITHDLLTPTSQPSMSEASELEAERTSLQSAAHLLGSPSNSAQPYEQTPNPEEPQGFNIDQSSISSSIFVLSSSSSPLSLCTDSEDDSTSSDGSTTSSSPSGPESRSSKRIQPDKVPPPKRHQSRTICRNFLQSGRCKKGNGCSFRHELPKRGGRSERRKQGKRESKKQRVGLYQRLVEQEKQKEKEERAEEEVRKAKLEPEIARVENIQTETAKVGNDTPA